MNQESQTQSQPQSIDCLLIGHNEMDFASYEKGVRDMGTESGAYRDLRLNFIRYNGHPYPAADMFNLFYLSGPDAPNRTPLNLGETFSAAVAYLGTYLHRRDLTFDYVNSFRPEKERLAQLLKGENILTIAIITTLYVSVLPIMEIMEFIREHNRTARVIIGGPFISTQCRTLDPDSLEYLFMNIDADFYVNSSQGEAALVNIIRALKDNHPPEKFAEIHNIYYRTPEDDYTPTPRQEEDNDLSQNMVDWDLFSHRAIEYAAVRTAVSCPFSCAFCGFPRHAGKYRPAPVDAVAPELERLGRMESLKSVVFIDDTFNVPPKRFKEILRLLIDGKYRFRWNSHYRCQYADRETVELMKAAGCEGVFLGIESGSDRILGNMNKAATVEQYRNGIALLKEYGILTYGSFVVGFPGETDQTVQETIGFIKESGLDYFRAQLWYCEPITPIWEKRDEYGLKGSQFEWEHATMGADRAAHWVEDIFMTVDNPVWVPQYNFECDGLFHLLHRGFTRDQVNQFLTAFNNGVRGQIRGNMKKEEDKDIDYNTVMQIKTACLGDENTENNDPKETETPNRATVDFDF